jgi:hypothetical protein
MKNWGEINTEFDSLLDDAQRTSYPTVLRISCFNRAAEFFAVTHTALLKTADATATASGDGTVVALPDDFMQLPKGGVQTTEGWLEPAEEILPGQALPTTGYATMGNLLYLFAAEAECTLWYYAKYPTVMGDGDYPQLPIWAEWAVMMLAMANMLLPSSMNQELLRQFQSRREAGSPEDNPPRKQARYLIELYNSIVMSVGQQNKGVLYTPGARM